ncbi:MAG: hypothetical protein JST86_14650 [Bacteroidetes bacterium]|nr:hypothetical protein [Bacteroidota bacterium]
MKAVQYNKPAAIILINALLVNCTAHQQQHMQADNTITVQFEKINHLLRDSAFAITVAAGQEAAYYRGVNQTVPPFDAEKDSTVLKSYKEEKLAINLAGFYALECGIGALVELEGKNPVYWLQQITAGKLDAAHLTLLYHFANATWKAGQPFKGLSRITRSNFIAAYLLPAGEIKKDDDQVKAAANIMLQAMQGMNHATTQDQFTRLAKLLKDPAFALHTAEEMEAAYYKGLQQPVPPFLTKEDSSTTLSKNKMEQKVAINMAGFYALECGLSYFATAKKIAPLAMVQSIVNGTVTPADKRLLERFANATWKAGQPFRGMERLAKDNFIPFYFLSEEEIAKDWVQITAMAAKLLPYLK